MKIAISVVVGKGELTQLGFSVSGQQLLSQLARKDQRSADAVDDFSKGGATEYDEEDWGRKLSSISLWCKVCRVAMREPQS